MSGRFILRDTALPDLKVIETKRLGDNRGFLERLYCAEELIAIGWKRSVVQINRTQNKAAWHGTRIAFPVSPAF